MMGRFIMKRLAVGVIQLFVLIIAVFLLIRLLPADPVARFVGLNASPEAYAAAKTNLGLDQPILKQLGDFLGVTGGDGLLQGSLGASWVTGDAVAVEIARALPVTLELLTYSFLVACIIGVPLGVLGAMRPGGAADKGTLVFGLFAGSQPEFSWAIIFIFVFFVVLGVAPGPLGRLSPLTDPPAAVTGFMTIDGLLAGRPGLTAEAFRYLALPVLTQAFILSGPIIKMVRQNMAEALQADFVLYARATGLPERQVALSALHAAFAPSMTLIGVLYGFMLGGAVLIESVFSLGGVGQYAIRSILAFDYPAIQGVVLVISAISLIVYLLIDILHAALDPRAAL